MHILCFCFMVSITNFPDLFLVLTQNPCAVVLLVLTIFQSTTSRYSEEGASRCAGRAKTLYQPTSVGRHVKRVYMYNGKHYCDLTIALRYISSTHNVIHVYNITGICSERILIVQRSV